MGKIIRLDTKLANMIAAGEVVERVSNVVKELVENAIDASATQITVLLEESGLRKIQVVDNGSGMDHHDALLAFERHATSKIKNEYDLFHIHSLGFRGEALPSIASVSHIELETTLKGEEGIALVFEYSQLLSKQTSTRPSGTSITVTKLFYNTPARFKYLKSPQSELSQIQDVMNQFALSYPSIAFTLSNQDKVMFQTSGNGQIIEVLAKIYGLETAKSMRHFETENRDYHINVFYSSPIQHRSSKQYITFSVNHRVVKNHRLSKEIIQAYDQLIPHNRYPIVFVDIIVDPLLIDVNIHPSKQEIKFSEEASLGKLIYDQLRNRLHQTEIIPKINTIKETPVIQESLPLHTYPEIKKTEVTPEIKQSIVEPKPWILEEEVNPIISTYPESKRLPELSYIGQYHGTYLLFQNQNSLFLMDQHAAAERIRYERYLSKMASPKPNYYELLVPIKLTLSNHEVILLERYLQDLRQFGIELQLHNDFYEITQVPAWFPRGMEVVYTEAVCRYLFEMQSFTIASIRDDLAKLLSCKHSLKANQYVSKENADELLKNLNLCIHPYTCPHGRPILIELHNHEIEKWFSRVE